MREWQDLSGQEKLNIINSAEDKGGLCNVSDEPPSSRKEVIVIGAGMAGLVAAHELQRAGFNVTILEARQSVGGRIRTIREPYFSAGVYGEAGAMRIPKSHELTNKYINTAEQRGSHPLTPTKFTMHDPNAYCFFNNRKFTWQEYAANPKAVYKVFDFKLRNHEISKTVNELFEETVLGKLRPMLDGKIKEGTRRDVALDQLMNEPILEDNVLLEHGTGQGKVSLQSYSTSRYLLDVSQWSLEAVNAFGKLESQQARMNNGIVALLREHLTNSFVDLQQIDKGMDLLPKSFLPELRSKIIFGAKVYELNKYTSKDKAKVHYKISTGEIKDRDTDHVILTLPFPMLRHITFEPSLESKKQTAIQELDYSESGKILLQCKRRFWEDEGIRGGRTQTDLGIRTIWYPTSPSENLDTSKEKQWKQKEETERAVLLVSYTWGRDSQRWTHLSHEDRIQFAINELSQIHDVVGKQPELIEGGYSIMWQNDEFAGGAFALTEPYQEAHDEDIRRPDGRLHFAGEHTSLNYHRWIEGAVESGLRAAWEVYHAR